MFKDIEFVCACVCVCVCVFLWVNVCVCVRGLTQSGKAKQTHSVVKCSAMEHEAVNVLYRRALRNISHPYSDAFTL